MRFMSVPTLKTLEQKQVQYILKSIHIKILRSFILNNSYELSLHFMKERERRHYITHMRFGQILVII
jgi:hypothetical protein